MNQSIKSHSFPILPVIRITIAITLVLLLIYYNVLPTYAQNSAKEYYDSGVVKAIYGDYQGAIEDYDKAIEIDHRYYATAYFNRGLAKGNLGDYREAIEDYDTAIQVNPKFSKAYYNRGLAKIELGQKYSGCLDLSKAGELGFDKAYESIKKYCK